MPGATVQTFETGAHHSVKKGTKLGAVSQLKTHSGTEEHHSLDKLNITRCNRVDLQDV